MSQTQQAYDVIIIGGSYAGLSAAMSLGRSLRKVLVIDSGTPCNRQTPHSHNFITQDGSTPQQISSLARQQVLQYPTVTLREDIAVSGRRTEAGFAVRTQSGDNFEGAKLIIASGVKDIMPDIKGFAECWGISVVHCPYCHGYEYRGRKTGILATGERAFHIASLVNNLTDDITLIAGGKAQFTDAQMALLQKHAIGVVETGVSEIEHRDGYLSQLHLSDGSRLAFDVVYAAIPFVQHSGIAAELGCELTEPGYIKTDLFQKTTVPGVYACGDATSMMRSVANAVATGNMTGAVVNKELTDERL